MRKLIPLFTAVLAIGSSAALSGEPPTAEELLTAYQKSVDHFTRARFQCVSKHPEQLVGDDKSLAHTNERSVVRDGTHWKVGKDSRFTIVENGTKREGGDYREMVVGGQLLEVIKNLDGTVAVTAWLDPTRVKQLPWRALGGAESVFGRFEGDADKPLWEVMRETSTLELLPETQEINGAKTYALESRGKFGEHTVWIDPDRGGLPRRIEIRKNLGDLYSEIQLGARVGAVDEAPRKPGSIPRAAPPRQPPDIRAFSLRVDDIQIEKRDGAFVMTAWKTEEKVTFGDGRPGDRREEHAVGAVDFKPETWPKDALRLTIEIPDKTRVSVRDGLDGTNYEWIGGEVRVRAR